MNQIDDNLNPFEKSPFFRQSSPHKLAELLRLSLEELELLCSSGLVNYKQFERDGRWVETPRPMLKRVQRRIHKLLGKIPPPDFLFSAYRGRSAVGNAGQHQGNVPMIKLDIRRFYPSSDGRRVFVLLETSFQCAPHISAMIWKLCTIKGTRNSSKSHLPTGGVTSAILAYFCYREMFQELADLGARSDVKMSVLADDITFSGHHANHSLLSCARKILKDHGLTANSRKNKIWTAKHNNKKVTGVLVTPKGLRVPKKRKEKIQFLREELRSEKQPPKRARLYQQLCGALSSAGQIESRFSVGARCLLQEWKNDNSAWQAHLFLSRRKHIV